MLDMNELAEICLKAADLIAEKGLSKKVLRDHTGALCNNGALMAALGMEEKYFTGTCLAKWPMHLLEAFTAIKIAEGRILEERGELAKIPWEYNDLDGTTAEDVILLLKITAERIRTMDIEVSINRERWLTAELMVSTEGLCELETGSVFNMPPGGMIKLITSTA